MQVKRSLHRRLLSSVQGEVMTDPASRARYATDASIYQMVPDAVVAPRSTEDIQAVMSIARDEGCPGSAARRRNIAMRADGQSRGGAGQHQTLEWHFER